jgi:hypothetical protein
MARRKPGATVPPDKDALGVSEKRGGYSGGADAATVPPPEKVPSAYQPASKSTGR